MSFHRGDPDMGDLPHRVHPDPDGRYTVDVHVSPDGHARIGGHHYTPEEFADILRRSGYDGRPVRLIGCDAGSNDFARRLSRALDTEVLAPNKAAWSDSSGRVFSSEPELGPHGERRPKIPPNGEWQVHRPDGTTTRATDDAFAPGTRNADKHDLDPNSARDRGDELPPDDTDAPPRNQDSRASEQPETPPSREGGRDRGDRDDRPAWERQEDRLLDPAEQQKRRQNPQQNAEFDPPSTRQGPDVKPGSTNPRTPQPHERFPGDQKLDPNTAYRVFDSEGNYRGTYHTDASGRVTHIDAKAPNVPARIKDPATNAYVPNPDYRHNPDLMHPNTTYRVEVDGQHQTFHTDADGLPEPGLTFHRPDYPSASDPVEVGPSSTNPKAPKPGEPFNTGQKLEPHTAYRVKDTNGSDLGTYYTDRDGYIRWAELESGRIRQTNNDLGRFPQSAQVNLVQKFDMNAPSGASRPEDFHGHTQASQSPVRLKHHESFFDKVQPPYERNARYVVTTSGKNPKVLGVYWTDEHGNLVHADTFRPHHPDMNTPQPNVIYSIDGGRFLFETGPEVTPRPGSRAEYRTDTVSGTSSNLELADPADSMRRSQPAQSESAALAGAEGRTAPHDGGHLVGNQFSGPGELLNMMAQLREQNQGRRIAGPDHWKAFEEDLASFLRDPDHTIERFEVFPLREDGQRTPHTIQARWVETVTDPVTGKQEKVVRMRSFPNEVPPGGRSGTQL